MLTFVSMSPSFYVVVLLSNVLCRETLPPFFFSEVLPLTSSLGQYAICYETDWLNSLRTGFKSWSILFFLPFPFFFSWAPRLPCASAGRSGRAAYHTHTTVPPLQEEREKSNSNESSRPRNGDMMGGVVMGQHRRWGEALAKKERRRKNMHSFVWWVVTVGLQSKKKLPPRNKNRVCSPHDIGAAGKP